MAVVAVAAEVEKGEPFALQGVRVHSLGAAVALRTGALGVHSRVCMS